MYPQYPNQGQRPPYLPYDPNQGAPPMQPYPQYQQFIPADPGAPLYPQMNYQPPEGFPQPQIYPVGQQSFQPMPMGMPYQQQGYEQCPPTQPQPTQAYPQSYQPMPMGMPYQPQGYEQFPPTQPQPPYEPFTLNYAPDDEGEYEEDDDEEDYESDDGEFEPFRGNPTVHAADPFDPTADAAVLRKAMKGFGTDEDALINVLCKRTSEQRLEIAEAFKKAYGKTLAEKIKSETSGKFETLMLALLTPLPDFYCRELKKPLSAKKILVEVLCSLYNCEIEDVKECYSQTYGQDLEAAILGDGDSNTFQALMVALCAADRDEGGDVDIDAAKEDANNLIERDDVFEHEGIFYEMLRHRNVDQIRTVFREYQIMRGKSFLKLIKKTFGGDEKKGMSYIFRCLNNKADFFAHQLHDAMEGLGTNDQKLIRLIITRCEIDMVEIKGAFQRMFGKSLKSFIKGDCSGDYKHALYALIGEERS